MVGIVKEKLIIYSPLIVICLLVGFLLYLVCFTTYRGYKAIQKGEWLKAIDYFVATALEVLFLYFMYTFIVHTINPNFRWLASLVVLSIMLSKTIFTLIILHINHRKIKETEAEKTENDAEIKAKPVKQRVKLN
ncbi:hypothetical protein, partial [Priestia megaterium]|uniref:hypothetical protein n=1 Tax=Priestia megaterium TaxID=1404 RepID=UPI00300BAA2E